MEEKKIVEAEENFDVQVVETKSNGLLTKVASGVKKHGKKIAAAAAIAAVVGLIGCKLRKKSEDEEYDDYVEEPSDEDEEDSDEEAE